MKKMLKLFTVGILFASLATLVACGSSKKKEVVADAAMAEAVSDMDTSAEEAPLESDASLGASSSGLGH